MVKKNYKDSLIYVAHEEFLNYLLQLGHINCLEIKEYTSLLDNEHTFELGIKKIRDKFKKELKRVNLDTEFHGSYEETDSFFKACENDVLEKAFIKTQWKLLDKIPFSWDCNWGGDGIIRFNLYDFNYQLEAEQNIMTSREHQLDIGFDEFLNEVDEKI